MTLAEPATNELLRIAADLAGRPVDTATPARAGGNNRVYRLACGNDFYALKFYPPQDADRRDRLGAEFRGLSFLARHGVTAVPKPLAADPARHCALYEWVPGAAIARRDNADIGRLAAFLGRLQDLRDAAGATEIGPASAACLAPGAALAQLDARLAHLRGTAGNEPTLARYLEAEFLPVRDRIAARTAQKGVAAPIAVLSPSDFGFHNALRRADGGLVFVDFEYFGWDDPVKAVCDVMLHPGMSLDAAERRVFLDGVAALFAGIDPGFTRRLDLLYPVFGLIWCLILLNEFLPERRARRALAGRHASNADPRPGQLEKSRHLLEEIARTHD